MTRALAVPAPVRAWIVQTWATLGVAVIAAGLIHVGAHAAGIEGVALHDTAPMVAAVKARLAPEPAPQKTLIWTGADVDGDGAPDFVNPTGKASRTEDAYGYGRFGASRDGGVRQHEGVDWMVEAGQPVLAPISGYITRIGFAYANAPDLKYVEVTNPALGYVARIFYVDPSVAVGQTVRLGEPVGAAHSLQARYPGGMTDHVHMELAGPDQRRFDATEVLTARYVTKRAKG